MRETLNEKVYINKARDYFSQNLNVLSVKKGGAWAYIKPEERVFKTYTSYINNPNTFEDISNNFENNKLQNNIENKIQYNDISFQKISGNLKVLLNLKTIKQKEAIKDFCKQALDSFSSDEHSEVTLDFSNLSLDEFKALDFLISSKVFLFKVYGPAIQLGQIRYKEFDEEFKFKIDEGNSNDLVGFENSKMAHYTNFLSDTNKQGFFLKLSSIKQLRYDLPDFEIYNFDNYEVYTKYQSLIESKNPETKNLFLPKSLIFGFDIELVKFILSFIDVNAKPKQKLLWKLEFETQHKLDTLLKLDDEEINRDLFSACKLYLKDVENQRSFVIKDFIRSRKFPKNAVLLLKKSLSKNDTGFTVNKNTFTTLHKQLNLSKNIFNIFWKGTKKLRDTEGNKSIYNLKLMQYIKYEDIKSLLKEVDDCLFIDEDKRLELYKETLNIKQV